MRRLLIVPFLLALPCFLQAAGKTKPNVVFIVADDLGFSDLGCFGGEIHTPNLGALAMGGLRFTQFYNAARCCPTRAALLTGQYQHKVGLARNGRSLTRNGATLAELLQTAGYQTAMSGKWHLSFTPVLADKPLHQRWLDHRHDPGQPFAPVDTYPASRGFDQHFGIIWGVVNHFDPFSLVNGLEPVREVARDFYFTDAIGAHAVKCVRDFAKAGRPFFLYVAHVAPHWPLHARPQEIAKYRDTYKDGWDALRRRRWQRQLELGLFDANAATLPPVQGEGPGWDDLMPGRKEFLAAKMAVHAAMVDRLDQTVGDLVAALKETGQFENTLIVFLADNGASPELPNAPGYDRSAFTRDGRKIRYEPDGVAAAELGGETSYAGIGPRWANAANTPFRFWKKESFEGGTHTACIAHWPAGLRTAPGATTETVGHVMDLVPTVLEIAGVNYPAKLGGHTLTPLDGRSLAPVLAGQALPPRGPLFFEHEGGRAVRDGDWKLVSLARGDWELYDLAKDRTETRNLAAREPERAKALAAAWQRWAEEVGVPGEAPDRQ
ncbi:MAG: arylsulfatase [Verrucomicrobiota bacterium]|nr:arylsulfatase [Verrucomicrobiota bacterium]